MLSFLRRGVRISRDGMARDVCAMCGIFLRFGSKRTTILPILSYPVLSSPILFHPILSYPILSYCCSFPASQAHHHHHPHCVVFFRVSRSKLHDPKAVLCFGPSFDLI